MRTALAHHFVKMLQERINGRCRSVFEHWALATGLRTSSQARPTASPSPRATSPLASMDELSKVTNCSTEVLVSPTLLRLGLSWRTAGDVVELRTLTASAEDTRGRQIHSQLPIWLRPSLRVSARNDAKQPRTVSLMGHVPDEVLAVRSSGGVVEYRVKWQGFASLQSITWELGSQLERMSGFHEALRRFRVKSASVGTTCSTSPVAAG